MKKFLFCISFVFWSCLVMAQLEKQIFEKKISPTLVLKKILDPIDIAIQGKAKEYNLGKAHNESATKSSIKNGGYFLRYENGWVYYNPIEKQCFAIWGDIQKKWAAEGYENGWMGYPIGNHLSTPNKEGAYVHFENGSIYFSPNTGTQIVKGDIKKYWANLGWENSPDLGFPTTGEVAMNYNGYTVYQQFEFGTVFWGAGKPILLSEDSKAIIPTDKRIKPANETEEDKNKRHKQNRENEEFIFSFVPYSFESKEFNHFDNNSKIDLYGYMDVRVYLADGTEVMDRTGKAYNIFNIPESNYLKKCRDFLFDNTRKDFIRDYDLKRIDIDNGAFIRIVYWINDRDDGPNDYLRLLNYSSIIGYNGGQHPYREIKISKGAGYIHDDTLLDITVPDGFGDYLKLKYEFMLTQKNKD
jgi:LGFP repeat